MMDNEMMQQFVIGALGGSVAVIALSAIVVGFARYYRVELYRRYGLFLWLVPEEERK